MGRHSATSSGGRSAIVGVVLGAAVLVGSGVTAVAMMSGDDPESARTATSSTTTSGGATTPSTPAPTGSPTGAATPTGASTSTGGRGAVTAQQALARCRAEVAAGARLATAAGASARDWGTHAGAQWKLDAGTIDYAEAEALWASSKKTAAADLSAFTSADAAYSKVNGACTATVQGTAGSALASQGAACATRGAALAQVARTGRVVNTQWAAHVEQMKGKATNAGHAYHMEWLRRTSDAKVALAAYDSAAKALTKAPTCSS